MTMAMVLLMAGCSANEAPIPTQTSGDAKPPSVSLSLLSPAERERLEPEAPLTFSCSIDFEPGGFEPLVTVFEISDPVIRKNSKFVITSMGIKEKKIEGGVYRFEGALKGPKKPGQYAVNAMVIGVDPRRPSTEPPQAPAADGTPPKPGAQVVLNAPRLMIKVLS
jgi:hypothetical protein